MSEIFMSDLWDVRITDTRTFTLRGEVSLREPLPA